jgi:hypothetical protein
MAIQFYSNNTSTYELSNYCGTIPTSVGSTNNLTDSGSPVPNDQARSCMLVDVARGTVITVTDSPSGATDDDFTTITALSDISELVISTFEQSFSNSQVVVSYTSKNGLDGKVSYVKVQAA